MIKKNIRHCFWKIQRGLKYVLFYLSARIKRSSFVITNEPIHGNIGDAAIALSEHIFIHDKFNSGVVSLNHIYLEMPLFMLKRIANHDTVVLHTGGGNIGTLWINEHDKFRKCIRTYSNNKFVVFPQTIYFSDDEYGNRILAETYDEMKKCKNLTVCVREKYSFDFMRENMPSIDVRLIPDMVLYLDKKKLGICEDKTKQKSGLLFCLRKDKEKTFDDKFTSSIIKEFQKRYPNEAIDYTDTVIETGIKPDFRKEVLVSKVEQFSKYRCVVTDRLHGMIIATIAETNCLITACNNYKIAGVYEWIKNNDYVQFVDNQENLFSAFQKIDFENKPSYDNRLVLEEFNRLKDIISDTVKG